MGGMWWHLLFEKRLKGKGIWGLVGPGEVWEWSGGQEPICAPIKLKIPKAIGINISVTSGPDIKYTYTLYIHV